eukprot:scaffold92604_cov79-Phaeocystis_antarctica.AAC.2
MWAYVLNQPPGPPGRSDPTCRANAGAHTPVPSCPFYTVAHVEIAPKKVSSHPGSRQQGPETCMCTAAT